MLQFSDLELRRGGRILIQGLSAQIHLGQKVAVVGRNGSGKSSLFALVLGDLHADAGDCSMPRNWKVGSVAQHVDASPQPAIEFVLDGDAELRSIEAALTIAEDTHDAHQIAHCHEQLHAIDGYSARARAGTLLHGLGFKPDEQTRPVASFSGGWRMRLALARTLMQRSDMMLLDEPTNHLDLDAVLWVQDWLRAYPGTLLVISHDRDFLDAISTHTLHLHSERGTMYVGNYSQFERTRAERLRLQSMQFSEQQKRIAHLQRFVDRFKAKASKAKQAQSRVKMIARMEQVAPVLAEAEFDFEFRMPDKLPAPLIRLDEAAAGYGERTVIGNIKLNLAPGDRLGVLGPNGEGKSTLMKMLAGALTTRAGQVIRHPELKLGYFAQHQLEQLNPAESPIEHFRELAPGVGDQALRDVLGTFNFRGDRAFEPVGPFSGGEKARLALAMIVYQKPNLLLLDEPTNHLDLEMRQALEMALNEFEGAVVLVAHDRHLMAACCDQFVRVADGAVQAFDGDLDQYAEWLSRRRRAQANATNAPVAVIQAAPEPAPAKPNKDQRKSDADQRAREKPLRDRLKKAEQAMTKIQTRLDEIANALQDAGLYEPSRANQLRAMTDEQSRLKQDLGTAETEWMEAAEALE
ncbi:ABC transporter ATP-binding protein [Ahniella affigens]|uniref:Probable ATP-binding protein YheS n=1 Tax=Ahniella affigens TaxID=2021234 RepID=A0A2P1PQ50_9GAMM|nr:ATP-binding cassette domain-containing protein [Ahniella affigens]AVP96976.1 ABC transporter ATP-binding protein [Ahniella affigens]